MKSVDGYRCDCGRTFDTGPAFGGHLGHCRHVVRTTPNPDEPLVLLQSRCAGCRAHVRVEKYGPLDWQVRFVAVATGEPHRCSERASS